MNNNLENKRDKYFKIIRQNEIFKTCICIYKFIPRFKK